MGLLDNLSDLPNIFLTNQPSYLPMVTGNDPEKLKALQNQSMLNGGIGALVSYLAQPKNQRYGSAIPYLAKAYQGGQEAAQNTYDSATKNYLTQEKIDQQLAQKKFIDKFTTENPELGGMLQAFPSAAPDVLSKVYAPKGMNVSEKTNEYAVANYGQPFLKLTPDQQKDVLKQVASASGVNINLGSPVAGVDAQGNPVFFQSNPKGGAPSIVQGVIPKASEGQIKQITGIQNLQGAIGDYKDALKTWSPADAANINKRAEMSTYYNNMMLQAKEAFNLGVLNGNDYKILTDVIADPTSAKGIAYGAFGALDKQADALNRVMEKMKTGMQSRQTYVKDQPAASQKNIVRTGTDRNGRKVYQYSDGSIGYGN
jgi:hypothetical protein